MKTYDIDYIKTANKVRGHFFFSPGAMRGFKSRVSSRVYQGPGGVYFVTSERFTASNGWSSGRYYSIRRYNPVTGSVDSVDEHMMPGEGLTRGSAHRKAARMAGKWPSPDLVERWRFFHQHAGYSVGNSAICAFKLAKAEIDAEGVLSFVWEPDDRQWDGDGPTPETVECCLVYAPEADISGPPLASLSGIGDPSPEYRRVVEAELAIEALAL
jgi:hypothetical protein